MIFAKNDLFCTMQTAHILYLGNNEGNNMQGTQDSKRGVEFIATATEYEMQQAVRVVYCSFACIL